MYINTNLTLGQNLFVDTLNNEGRNIEKTESVRFIL